MGTREWMGVGKRIQARCSLIHSLQTPLPAADVTEVDPPFNRGKMDDLVSIPFVRIKNKFVLLRPGAWRKLRVQAAPMATPSLGRSITEPRPTPTRPRTLPPRLWCHSSRFSKIKSLCNQQRHPGVNALELQWHVQGLHLFKKVYKHRTQRNSKITIQKI